MAAAFRFGLPVLIIFVIFSLFATEHQMTLRQHAPVHATMAAPKPAPSDSKWTLDHPPSSPPFIPIALVFPNLHTDLTVHLDGSVTGTADWDALCTTAYTEPLTGEMHISLAMVLEAGRTLGHVCPQARKGH